MHLDDTNDDNGCIRILRGSHKNGGLTQVEQNQDGTPCEPYLPNDAWNLEDTVPVPARRGDMLIFHYDAVHVSRINQTDRVRRIVRIGYRHPANQQFAGQSKDRPRLMV